MGKDSFLGKVKQKFKEFFGINKKNEKKEKLSYDSYKELLDYVSQGTGGCSKTTDKNYTGFRDDLFPEFKLRNYNAVYLKVKFGDLFIFVNTCTCEAVQELFKDDIEFRKTMSNKGFTDLFIINNLPQ